MAARCNTVPPPRQSAPRRGVTIMELLVIVAILAILSGSITLMYGTRREKTLVLQQADKIQKTLELARAKAIQSTQPCQVTFWIEQPSFWIDEIDGDGDVTQRQVTTPEKIHEQLVLEGVDSSSTQTETAFATVRFFPNGSSDDAYIWIIHEQAEPSELENFTTVKVYGPTGRVRVFPNEKKINTGDAFSPVAPVLQRHNPKTQTTKLDREARLLARKMAQTRDYNVRSTATCELVLDMDRGSFWVQNEKGEMLEGEYRFPEDVLLAGVESPTSTVLSGRVHLFLTQGGTASDLKFTFIPRGADPKDPNQYLFLEWNQGEWQLSNGEEQRP